MEAGSSLEPFKQLMRVKMREGLQIIYFFMVVATLALEAAHMFLPATPKPSEVFLQKEFFHKSPVVSTTGLYPQCSKEGNVGPLCGS